MASFKQNPNTKTWSFIIDVGRDMISSRRNQKTVSKDANGRPFETERDARKHAVKMEQEIERGKKYDSVTLKDFITQYFERVVTEKVAEVTYDNQWQSARDYVIPFIGKMKIDKITDIHIEALYEKLMEDGVSRGRIRNLGIVLSKTFRHAQKKRLIMDNPMKLVTTPSYKPDKIQVWSQEQVSQFLANTKQSKFHALYVVAYATGTRRGELLALNWSDIDLDKRTVTINKAVKYSLRSKKHVKGAKTENSRRTIRIPKYAVEALKAHKEKQMEGISIVFDNFGEHYLPGELSRCFQTDRQKTGLPYIKFHGMRHAHATHLLQEGFNARVVAERLGDTVDTVLKTYAHVLPTTQDEVADALDNMFDPVDNSPTEP